MTGQRPAGEGGRADQVARRMRFSRDHPQVTFAFRRETGQWEAAYPAAGGGTRTVHGMELRYVLDDLEKRFGYPPGQRGE